MPKSDRQKLKLLYIMKILSEETDENHPMPMAVLLERLGQYEIQAERKSIYSDIGFLNDFGEDIAFNPSKTDGGYFLCSRTFELPELKLLVDAVLASKFITATKSQALIRKIEQLTSKQEAVQLQHELFNTSRIKNENEGIYYHIDTIEKAIHENRMITFPYMEWSFSKQLVPRKNGLLYRISPWALLWNDENYYLIGYDDTAGIIKHFRVDKIGEVTILEELRKGKEVFEACNLETYSTKTFGMYGGQEDIVTLSCRNHLVGVMLDRFGKDVSLQKEDDDSFMIHVKVAVSAQFFGWVTGIGQDVKIVSPVHVQEEYHAYLNNILKEYEKSAR